MLKTAQKSLRYSYLILLLLCTGCDQVELQNPLVSPEEAKPYPEFYGVYRSRVQENRNEHTTLIRIEPAGNGFPPGFMKISFIGYPLEIKEGLDVKLILGFLEPVQDFYLFHLPITHGDSFNQKGLWFEEDWESIVIDKYFILRVEIESDNQLTAYLVDFEFIKNSLENNQLKGTAKKNKEIIKTIFGNFDYETSEVSITNKSKELKKFFEETSVEELGSEPVMILSRMQ